MSFLSRMFGSSPVRLSQNLGAYPLPNGDISPLYVFFGIVNKSDASVEVTSTRIIPKGNSEPLDVRVGGDLPATLRPGENIRYEVRAKVLAEASRAAGHTGKPKLTFVVTDRDGNEHRHDFELRVDEYIALKDE